MAARGVEVSYETIRCWTIKFGPAIARNLRRAHPSPPRAGTSTRWWCASAAGACSCGALSTTRASSWTWWCSDGATRGGAQASAPAAEEPGDRARDGGHRRAALLRRRHGAAGDEGATPTWATAGEQPHREQPPAAAKARAGDEEVQVAGLSPALPRHSCSHRQRPQPPAPSDLQTHPSPLPQRRRRPTGERHCRCLRREPSLVPPAACFS